MLNHCSKWAQFDPGYIKLWIITKEAKYRHYSTTSKLQHFHYIALLLLVNEENIKFVIVQQWTSFKLSQKVVTELLRRHHHCPVLELSSEVLRSQTKTWYWQADGVVKLNMILLFHSHQLKSPVTSVCTETIWAWSWGSESWAGWVGAEKGWNWVRVSRDRETCTCHESWRRN